MVIFIDIIIIILIFIAIYTGGNMLLGGLFTNNALDQIQWLLYLAIFTSALGFIGLLANKKSKI
jgi:hypothetical protein